jgi:hypothetical protein
VQSSSWLQFAASSAQQFVRHPAWAGRSFAVFKVSPAAAEAEASTAVVVQLLQRSAVVGAWWVRVCAWLAACSGRASMMKRVLCALPRHQQ